MRPVFDAVTQNVDDATFSNFTLETSEKFLPNGAGMIEVKRLGGVLLRCQQKNPQLHEVYGIFTVIVFRITKNPDCPAKGKGHVAHDIIRCRLRCRVACHRGDDEAFESFFACISAHASASSTATSRSASSAISSPSATTSAPSNSSRSLASSGRVAAASRTSKFAGHYVGDQASAVLAEEGDFTLGTVDGSDNCVQSLRVKKCTMHRCSSSGGIEQQDSAIAYRG